MLGSHFPAEAVYNLYKIILLSLKEEERSHYWSCYSGVIHSGFVYYENCKEFICFSLCACLKGICCRQRLTEGGIWRFASLSVALVSHLCLLHLVGWVVGSPKAQQSCAPRYWQDSPAQSEKGLGKMFQKLVVLLDSNWAVASVTGICD